MIKLHDLGRSSSTAKFDPQKPYDTTFKYFEWGSSGDIPGLKNWDCNNGGYASTAQTGDHDNEFWSGGKDYTDLIVKSVGNDLQYAAPAAKAFYPYPELKSDEHVGEGKWYLPTLGELMDLYGYDYSKVTACNSATEGGNGNTKNLVNATLTTLKGKGVTVETLPTTGSFYWSSSEYDSTYSWGMNNANNRINGSKSNNHSVRASLEF